MSTTGWLIVAGIVAAVAVVASVAGWFRFRRRSKTLGDLARDLARDKLADTIRARDIATDAAQARAAAELTGTHTDAERGANEPGNLADYLNRD